MKKEGLVEALCTILENNGALDPKDTEALKKNFANRSQDAFDDFLLEEGLVEREAILEALSIYYKVPYMDPIGYFFDHYLITQFPKDFLLRNLIIPIEVVQDAILIVAANNPADEELLPALGNYVSYDIEFRVSIASDIIDSVEEFYDKSLTDIPSHDDVFEEQEEDTREDFLNEIENLEEE